MEDGNFYILTRSSIFGDYKMEASVRWYIDELKKYIEYWVGYRDNMCVPIADDVLRNIMIDTLNEIIQNRQEELKEWSMDLEDLNISLE